jgi:predicted  nucleic acid-binding Zn-ribbon protein
MNRISDERLAVAEAEAAIRAASITPPAPERSKEEVKALEIAKRWAIWIDGASAGEEDEGGYLRAAFEADKATLLSAISQAQSALADMRVERDALARHSLKAGNDAARMAIEVKRLTEENEALRKERDEAREVIATMDKTLQAVFGMETGAIAARAATAEARIKALEEAQAVGVDHIETLSELLKIIKEHWIDYDHVFSIAVDEADKFVAARTTLNSKENKD